jgi:rhodanese-related sulfurtransferase
MEQVIEFVGNHIMLAGIWLTLIVVLIYSMVSAQLSPIKELSPQEATMLINRQDAMLLDIRPVAEFNKGHILGSRQLKAEQVTKADFSSLEKNKDKPIIVVCAMGMTAKRTAAQMLKAGFNQVSVLKGGLNAWTGASLPVNK